MQYHSRAVEFDQFSPNPNSFSFFLPSHWLSVTKCIEASLLFPQQCLPVLKHNFFLPEAIQHTFIQCSSKLYIIKMSLS